MNSDTTPSTPTLSAPVFDALPELIRSYIRFLEATIQKLEVRVHDLETRLAKNSSNSSKPPSSDGLKKKPKSQREKSGKKSGGQQGHVGKSLLPTKSPDVIATHTPINCDGCGSGLSEVIGSCAESRQVFDISQPKAHFTSNRCLVFRCPRRRRGYLNSYTRD